MCIVLPYPLAVDKTLTAVIYCYGRTVTTELRQRGFGGYPYIVFTDKRGWCIWKLLIWYFSVS